MKAIPYLASVQKEGSVVVEADELPSFCNYPHYHNEMQIALIESGEGTLIAGNYSQPFEAAQVYIIGANQPHLFKAATSRPQSQVACKAVHIFFDAEKIKPFFAHVPELCNVEKIISKTGCGMQLTEAHRQRVSREIHFIRKTSGLTRFTTLLHLLEYIATEVKDCRDLVAGPNNPLGQFSGFRMEEVYRYTLAHYNRDITIDEIAQVACLTPHAFCKYFKKHTRKTYLTFLNEFRISEACKKMMNEGYQAISSVAYATGFNNAVTFNRVFKRVSGMSPSDYAKRARCGQV